MSNKKSHYNKLASAEDTEPEPLMLQSFRVSLAYAPLLPHQCHVSATALPKGKPQRASEQIS